MHGRHPRERVAHFTARKVRAPPGAQEITREGREGPASGFDAHATLPTVPSDNLRHTGVLNDQTAEPGKALSTHFDAGRPLQCGQALVRLEEATDVDVQVVTVVAVP